MSSTPAPAPAPARGLPLLVALSGAAALVYESLWMRGFGLIFGGTTQAIAMVLAVFMGGLALGGALVARRTVADPLRAYARLEQLTGLFALLTLPLLRALPWLYGALVARFALTGALESAGIALLAALVLLPPTTLLGATVPLAVEFLVRSGGDPHRGFGRLYLLNTLGGAAGVALAPFVLVPALGVRGTLVAAAAVSLFVGSVARRWARESAPPPAPPPREPAQAAVAQRLSRHGLALAFASGAATFGAEVLWTRSYALVIGSTVYAFNLMLLAVLLGIAIGSAVYGGVGRRRITDPAPAVGALYVAAGLALVAGAWVIGRLPVVTLAALKLLPVSFAAQQAALLGLCIVTLLPVTALLGLSFPMLLHLTLPDPSPGDAGGGAAQRAAGRLYAWNTAGAIAGALAADLVLVPRLGLQPPYLVFAALLVAPGVWLLALSDSRRPTLAGAGAALAVVVAAVALVPRFQVWDPVLMSSGVHRYGLEWVHRLESPWRLGAWLREQRRLLFYREGREAVVAVSEPRGGTRRFLSVNGKTDAGSGTEDVVTQKFLAHVPLLLHSDPKRVLVIGWGAGATAAAAAAHPIASLECVEIEPATWEAAPFFADFSEPLRRDARFKLVFRDGRNHLLRARGSWDVVVSEPSNPWITGVSNLFTREFLETARDRLAPGGLFAQWFHYYNLAPGDVKVEVKTFLSVFEHASLWLVPPVGPEHGIKNLAADMLLVGSREPQRLSWPRLGRAYADEALARELRSTLVIDDAVALAATWTMGRPEMERWAEDRQAFPSGTPLNTDDNPYLEFVAPRRTVVRPSEAAREATAQYAAMGAAAGDPRSVLADVPALAAGGTRAAELLRGLAERLVAAVQPDRASQALDAAIALDPDDVASHERAAILLVDRGRPREAERQYGEVVRLDPARASAWEAIGGLALDRRDYARAVEAHRALVKLQPTKVSAWLRLAAALAREQRWGEAREAIAKAQALDPKAPVDPQLLQFLEQQTGPAVPRR
jgi:spermidine synthase